MEQNPRVSTTITSAESEEIMKMNESAQRDYLEARKNANGIRNANTSSESSIKCLCDESTSTASVITPLGITKLATFAKLSAKPAPPDGRPPLLTSSEGSINEEEESRKDDAKGDPAAVEFMRIEQVRDALHGLPSPRIIPVKVPKGPVNVMFSPDLKYASIVTDSLEVTVVHMDHTVEACTIRAASPSLQTSFSRIAAALSFGSAAAQTPARVLGCIWVYSDTLVIVTTETVEVYTIKGVHPTLAKSFSFKITWFKYSRKRRTVFALTSQNTIQPFDFSERGEYTKPYKIELEKAPQPGFVPSKHVGIVEVCGDTFVAQLSWPEKKLPQPCITLFPYNKEIEPIRLVIPYGTERDGNVSFQSIDNLVVVHDLMHKVSFFYDLTISGLPVIPCPVCVNSDEAMALIQEPVHAPTMYDNKTVFTGESKVVDTRDGSLWEINLNLEKITRDIEDRILLVNFLLRRADGKNYVMRVVQEMILTNSPIKDVSTVFDCINRVFLIKAQEQRDAERSLEQQGKRDAKICPRYIEIMQSDLFEYFFSSIDEDKRLSPEYIISVLTEYIRSLSFNRISVEPYLYGKLIQVIVRAGKFYQLHQLIQYHVISDSVHVACKLLSLEAQYPPAFQLALDMFKRLDEGDHIIEVLLAKKDIISTLRFIQSNPRVCVQPHRLLEIAKDLDDPALLYTVFKFFEKRKDLPEGYVLDDPRLFMNNV